MTSHWQLQPIFGSPLWAFALGLLLVVVLFLRPTFGHLTPSRQRVLTAIRALIAFLLLLAMLRPTYIRTEKQTQSAEVTVLFDTSTSMTHRDGDGGMTRWQQQLSLLRSAKPKLAGMGDNFRVELVGFSDAAQTEAGDDMSIRAKPVGEQTDIGLALNDTLQRHAGKRIAAVILISDGAQRAIAPKVPPQQAARQLDRLATPLYTIALGQSRDQSQSRDVAIETLQDEYSVFVKNEFALRVGVKIQGYVQQPIPLSVVVEAEDGTTKTLGPLELVATQDSQIVMADFSFRPEKAGEYRLLVKADGQPGEMIDNNQKTAFLTVRDGGLRVLLLSSGILSQEQKFIRRTLDESQDIQLDYHLESVSRRRAWPTDLQSTEVRLEDYDVFVVGGVDARAFRPDDWSKIAKLVEDGSGFMMYGGYHSFGPGGYAKSAIAKLLPVELGQYGREPDPTKVTRTDRHIEGALTMVPTTDSPITFLLPDAENVAEWRKVKPLRGVNKFQGLKNWGKLLAKTNGGAPLLVQGSYVKGRVLALGTDETHRWYRFGRPDVHKKFWRQSILWLAQRDKKQANSVFIELPQRRFDSGRKVNFQTGLTDELGDVIVDANLRANLLRPDGTTQSVQLAPHDAQNGAQIANALQGLIADTSAPGNYRIRVEAIEGDRVLASTNKDFVVEKRDFELGDPAANPGLLEMLSRITERAGGKAVAPEQLSSLLDEIKASPPKSEVETQSKWQLGDTMADAWSYFGALILLLSAEWFLRKKWGLV